MIINTRKKVIIVGGGTAGWMTAAALAHFSNKLNCDIELIESDAIGTVGVGEATLPHLRHFNQTLGIDEQEFMSRTNATYKLGIEFSNWGALGQSYIHPFGDFGTKIDGIDFHHYWLKLRQAGDMTPIGDYSLPVCAAQNEKFQYPHNDPSSILSTFSYAFHLDAGLYSKFLREYAEARKVTRTEGKVIEVTQSKDSGNILSVCLDNGLIVDGDLFIDCSGFRALLIEKTLKTGFESWEKWLPCDRAIALPCSQTNSPLPYTKATAQSEGWQWKIPLQHRTGNGYVYSSSFSSEEKAQGILLKNIDGIPQSDPTYLRFTAGKRKVNWNKNCVAIWVVWRFP